jgi:hypothetical protein
VRGSVWQCTRQCVAVHLVVYESARGSVRLCYNTAVCCSAAVCSSAVVTVRQCGSVRLCGMARVCGSTVVYNVAAVCGSVRVSVRQCVAVCGSARSIVWWQCALRLHVQKFAHNVYFILLYPSL